MSNSWIVIVFMLFFVLVMALYLGSQSYNAYIPSRSGLSEYPYEGFAGIQEAFENREGFFNKNSKSESESERLPKPPGFGPSHNPVNFPKPHGFGPSHNPVNFPKPPGFGPSPNPVNFPKPHVDQSLNPAPITGSLTSIFKQDSFATFDKEGFESTISKQISEDTKFTGASYSDQKPIGFMYNNQGSPTCKNYGYTNSQGFICMSEGDIQLLTTRGGNASGASDQIGK